MSTDAKKAHGNVIAMPDIYAEDAVVEEAAAELIELADSEPEGAEDIEGFDPYDTARLYKDKIRSTES